MSLRRFKSREEDADTCDDPSEDMQPRLSRSLSDFFLRAGSAVILPSDGWGRKKREKKPDKTK